MSLNYTIYLGPYASCKLKVVKNTLYRKHCGNKNCQHFREFNNASFCATCGSPIVSEPYEKEEPALNWGEVSEAIKEALYAVQVDTFTKPAAFIYWLPNQRGKYLSFDPRDTSSFADAVMNEERITTETQAFTEKYQKALQTLASFYEEVTVCYGLIHNVH